MSHLSIIYAPADEEFAQQLVSDLQEIGIPTTADMPGENHEPAGLHDAIAVAVILSPDTLADDVIRRAVAFALDHDQVLLPILARPTAISRALESSLWLDMSTSALYDAQINRLVGILAHTTNLVSPEMLPVGFWHIPPPDTSGWTGVSVDVALDMLTVPDNTTDLCNTQLRHYLPILAVIASPLAMTRQGVSGRVADVTSTWRNLANALLTAYRLSDEDDRTSFALRRLAPPTADHLRDALSIPDPDAYPIVHLFAPHFVDTVALETGGGLEDAIDATRLLSILRESHARLLIAATGLHEDLVATLLSHTAIEAIITVEDNIPPMAEFLLNSRFYEQILAGKSVDTAFDYAIEILQKSHPEVVENISLHRRAGVEPLILQPPSEASQADRPLIDPAMPRLRNVPVNLGFVGQNLALHEVDVELLDEDIRLVAIYGDSGVGKSWLASEYVARFAWNYPDGIVWMRISEQTKAEDILGQVAALLELPADIARGDLRVRLRDCDVLVILDQADEWGDPLEVAELADFVARVDISGGVRFLLTAEGPVEPLTHVNGTRTLVLEAMSPEDATALIQGLIVDYDLQAAFDGVDDGLSAFLSLTQSTPWLIHKGIELVQQVGLVTALEDLTGMVDEVAHQIEYYIELQLDSLTDELTEARQFLRQLQGIPDSFDRDMAEAIGGAATQQYLRDLLQRGLLHHPGILYSVPSAVRSALRYRMPLSDEEQDHVDQLLIQHFLSRDIWSDVLSMSINATRLTRAQQALLNNLRAIIKRQIRPLSSVDPALVAEILLTVSDTMLDAVLAHEQYEYLDQIRRQIPAGTIPYAQLTAHMAVMMDAVDELRDSAGEMHQGVLHSLAVLEGEEQRVHAEAFIGYGRHLIKRNALDAAYEQFQSALDLLAEIENRKVAAVAFGDLGQSYAERGLFEAAVQHYETALQLVSTQDAVATERVRLSYEFGMTLVTLTQYERAEALLMEALATCDRLGLWALRGQVRRALAYVAQQRAEGEQDTAIRQDLLDHAETLFQQAVTDLLPVVDTLSLAIVYHDVGRLQMQKRSYGDAQAHIEKSCLLFGRLGSDHHLAVATTTLGQVVLLASGDVKHSIHHLQQALDLANAAHDPSIQSHVAQALVRVHQLQLRRAVSQPAPFRHQVIEQVATSRKHLHDADLMGFTDPLDEIILQLEAMEKSSDAPPAE